MPRKAAAPAQVKILQPEEYPAEIARPDVKFAAVHPLGLYHVEHHGAGHHVAYFTPKRRGSRPRNIGGASSVRGALRRISNHEDQELYPTATREEGKTGAVSIYSLGQRTQDKKPPTRLDAEIEAYLATHDD